MEVGREGSSQASKQWHRHRQAQAGLTERGQGKVRRIIGRSCARVQRERGEGSCVRAALVEDGGGGGGGCG